MSTPPSNPKNPGQPGASAPWPIAPGASTPGAPTPGAAPPPPGGPSTNSGLTPAPLVTPSSWPIAIPTPARPAQPAVTAPLASGPPPTVNPTAWPPVAIPGGPAPTPPPMTPPQGYVSAPQPGYAPAPPPGFAPPPGAGYALVAPGFAPPPPGYQPAPPPGYPAPQAQGQYPIYLLQNVIYRYPRGKFELRVPSLAIMPGQLTYIGGETGCGKSTLLKLLALQTVPQQGDVVIMGFPVKNLPQNKRDDLRGGGVVYLAQGDMGLQNLLPVENIRRLLCDFDGLSKEDAERLALDGLQVAQFPADRLDVKAMDLSGGEKARVALAKLYAARRPICLTDETLGPLDDKMRLRLIYLFQMLAAQQFTIISIEHQPQLMDYFDRVITLKQGQIESVVDHPRKQVQTP